MSTTTNAAINVLFVRSAAVDVDDATMADLRAAAPDIEIGTAQGPADAFAEIRRAGSWQAVVVSSGLPHNETLALIAAVRRDRLSLAIVPVVEEARQTLFASAIASGADDVLLRRGRALVNIADTLARIRQSPYLFPIEQQRRINVLYAGRDPLVWNLLEQVPFVNAEKAVCGADGSCPVRAHGAGDDSLRTDAVVIDEQPSEAYPLLVLKSVRAQTSDLPVVVLTSMASGDVATAALELGADDTVPKTGMFRQRLVATLRRVHQRLELTARQADTRAREERLRQIVENVPTGIAVIGANGIVFAMNATALGLFGADKPRDVVGQDFRQFVSDDDNADVTELLHRVATGAAGSVDFHGRTLDGTETPLTLRGVVLERDARGGLGIIASLTRTGTDSHPVAEHTRAAELEDARARERDAWEAERRRLEAALEAAGQVTAERAALTDRLTEVTDELARTNDTFAAERRDLEQRVQELEAAGRDAAVAGAARMELEIALDRVREELSAAVAGHALERSGWQAIRETLESRVHDLDAARLAQDDHASTLEGRIRQLDVTLAQERETRTAAQAQLETELRHAREALQTEHTQRDTRRAAFDAERDDARQTFDNERQQWVDARAALERDIQTLREAADAGRHDMDGLRGELQRTRDIRAAIEAERDDLHGQLDALRSALDAERDDKHRQIDALGATADGLRATLDETRIALECERDDARRTLAEERTSWDGARATIEQTLADGRHAREQDARLIESLRSEMDRTRGQHAQAVDSYTRLIASDLFGHAVTTRAGELVRCNDAFARVFGFAGAPDALARTSGRPFPGLAGRANVAARLAADGHVDRLESCLERLDGQPVRIIESATLLADSTDGPDDDTLVEHIVLGETTGPDLEQWQGKRLQDVGALATAMTPEIETLTATLHQRATDRDADLGEVAVLTARLSALVRQLGAFSRRHVRAAAPIDLGPAAGRVEPMLARLVGEYIAFSLDLSDTSPVIAEPDDLEQLFTSLVTFGRDLLPAGGAIVVQTRQKKTSESADNAADSLNDPALIVHASGYGVLLPDRPASLEQVAERCGGRLQIFSEAGRTVRLEVTFPRCVSRTKSSWGWASWS